MRQDDGDRLGMLIAEQPGGLHRIEVPHEIERDDLLGLVNSIEQLVGFALSECLGEELESVVLATGQDAGVGKQPGVGLLEDGVASDRIDGRHAHQLEGDPIDRFRRQAREQLCGRLRAERDEQRGGLARSAQSECRGGFGAHRRRSSSRSQPCISPARASGRSSATICRRSWMRACGVAPGISAGAASGAPIAGAFDRVGAVR